MQKIVFASGNKGKIKEVAQILEPLGIEVVPQSDFDTPDVEETGTTFVENAIIKARHAAKHCGLPALADDSGIEVDALNGAPGVYSARFSGKDANDQSNNERLLADLANVADNDRTARYQCLMVFMTHHEDATPAICQGTWEGRITTSPQGDQGFGYDPLFWAEKYNCTAAELPPHTKNEISHRGQALRALHSTLKKYKR